MLVTKNFDIWCPTESSRDGSHKQNIKTRQTIGKKEQAKGEAVALNEDALILLISLRH